MNYKGKAVRATVALGVEQTFTTISYAAVTVLSAAVCAAKGFTAAEFAIFFSLYGAGSMITNGFYAKLVQILGAKKLAIIAAFGPIVGFGLLAFSNSLIVTWTAGLVFGLMNQGGGFAAYNNFVSNWFNRGRSTMITVSPVIMAIVMALGVPMIASAAQTIGIVYTCIGVGAIASAVCLICALFFICDLPSVYDTTAVDIGKEKAQSAAKASVEVYESKMPVTKILTMPAAIILFIFPIIATIAATMFSTYAVYAYQSFGLEYIDAAKFLSVTSIAGMVLSLAFGPICNKIGDKGGIIAYAALLAAGFLFAPVFGGSVVTVAILAVCFSANNYTNFYSGVVYPPLFGRKNSATLIGLTGMLRSCLTMLAAPMAVALVEMAGGSYKYLLLLVGGTSAIVALITFIFFSKKTKDAVIEKDKPYLEAANAAAATATENN